MSKAHTCKECGISLMPWEDTTCANCLEEESTIQEDFLAGKFCNPDAPEECESCQ